ncbi:putative glycolipid-binding domain-containing protein (plasmid) [Haloferacaceae archaeon DSL9]
MNRDVFWRPVESIGLEHLRLTERDDGAAATGLVLGTADGDPFRLRYWVDCDRRYRVERVALACLEPHAESLELESDGNGRWTADNEEAPEIEGCVDIDISATPFSNTLPIRRLSLDIGESERISVAYISVPTLDVRAIPQRYTRLENAAGGERRYRYENLANGYSAELPVDEDGLVLDYPDAFDRAPTATTLEWERRPVNWTDG